MALLAIVVLLVLSAAGLTLVSLGLPGTWLTAGAIVLCVGLSPKAAVTLTMLGGLLGFCLAAEGLEFLVGTMGAHRYGVSKAGIWGSIIGGFLGMLLLNVPGIFLGTFLGAFLLEAYQGKENALRLGWGALVARLCALAAKMAVTLAMAAFGLIWLL